MGKKMPRDIETHRQESLHVPDQKEGVIALHWWAQQEDKGPEIALPIRGNKVEILIDAEAAFREFSKKIEIADESIWITSWDIDPDLKLIRDSEVETRTLLCLLIEKAKAGVDVRVILSSHLDIMYHGRRDSHRLLGKFGERSGVHVILHKPSFSTSAHQKSMVIDRRFAFVGGIDMTKGRWDNKDHTLTLYKGASPYDEANDLHEGAHPLSDVILKIPPPRMTPRLPWHDLHTMIEGPAVADVTKNFTERWNNLRRGARKLEATAKNFRERWNNVYDEESDIPEELMQGRVSVVEGGPHVVQVVRTIDRKSGAAAAENSILQTYIKAIKNAQHYIYIENQYLISRCSSSATDDTARRGHYRGIPAENGVAYAIVERIHRAIQHGGEFCVLIVLPIVPWGVELGAGVLTRNTLKYMREEVVRKLVEVGRSASDVNRYFLALTLRAVAKVKTRRGADAVITEQIYVHSKCMIVDDRCAIVGSSNINDRGLLSGHDPELNVVIFDEVSQLKKIGGVKRHVRELVQKMRIDLWCEHFRMEAAEVADPLEAFARIVERATSNSNIYQKIFNRGKVPRWGGAGGVPSDQPSHEGYEDPTPFPAGSEALSRYEELGAGLRGHALLFPIYMTLDSFMINAPNFLKRPYALVDDPHPTDDDGAGDATTV